jgi:hypothetical protein
VDEVTAVPEAPAAPTLEELQAQVESKQLEYELLHETYTELWQQRKAATLDDMGYVRYLRTEDRMALLLHELEVLRPARDVARLLAKAHAAKAHHDAAVPGARVLAAQAVQLVCELAAVRQRLVTYFDEQTTPLVGVRDRQNNHQAFDLGGGAVDALNLFAVLFPNDPRVADLFGLLAVPPNVGQVQEALAQCPRLRPFSPRAISTYLASIEGASNGSKHG